MAQIPRLVTEYEALVHVRGTTADDHACIRDVVRERWGATTIVARGLVYETLKIESLIAEFDGHLAGIATYCLCDDECEIVTLDALQKGCGVGTALVDQIVEIARARQARLLTLVISNDNLDALRFFQRRGFTIAHIWPDSQEQNRQIKPTIPHIGRYGIPIRDEIELVRGL